MKYGRKIIASLLTGFLLPPIVGTFLVFAITPFVTDDKHQAGVQWAALLVPIVEPFVFLYAFIAMGPSSLIFSIAMTLLGLYWFGENPDAPLRLKFIGIGAGLGLLAPLGIFIWASSYSSWEDYYDWFRLMGPSGSISGAITSSILVLFWKTRMSAQQEAGVVREPRSGTRAPQP